MEPYARICADPEVMRYIGNGSPLPRERCELQISGFVGLAHQEAWTEGKHKTEVGWRLDRGYRGRGLATEGALASVHYRFEPGLERIISIIQPQNAASRRVAEKAGLTLQEELGWRGNDVVWYAAYRGEWCMPEAEG